MALVDVKLSGRWGLVEVERELGRGPVDLDVPEQVTGAALVRALAARYPRFGRKALTATGALRAEVRLFVGDGEIEDLTVPIGERLRRGGEISIFLLAPLVGG